MYHLTLISSAMAANIILDRMDPERGWFQKEKKRLPGLVVPGVLVAGYVLFQIIFWAEASAGSSAWYDDMIYLHQ